MNNEVLAGLAFAVHSQNKAAAEKNAARYDKNAFNAEYNTSIRLRELEHDIEASIEQMAHELRTTNVLSGIDIETGVEDIKRTFDKKAVQYYVDEMRDQLTESNRSTTRRELDTQVNRLQRTLDTLDDALINDTERKFLKMEYKKSIDFLRDQRDSKRGIGGQIGAVAKDQIGNYLDLRSLYSGFVNNNPVMMALFGIASDLWKGRLEEKRERKKRLAEDTAKENIMEADIHIQDSLRKLRKDHDEEVERLQKKYDRDSNTNQSEKKDNVDDAESKKSLSEQFQDQEKEREVDVKNDEDRRELIVFKKDLFGRLDTMIKLMRVESGGMQFGSTSLNKKGHNISSKLQSGANAARGFSWIRAILGGGAVFGAISLTSMFSLASMKKLMGGTRKVFEDFLKRKKLFEPWKTTLDKFRKSFLGKILHAIRKTFELLFIGVQGILSGIKKMMHPIKLIKSLSEKIGKGIRRGGKFIDRLNLGDKFSAGKDKLKDVFKRGTKSIGTKSTGILSKLAKGAGGLLSAGALKTGGLVAGAALGGHLIGKKIEEETGIGKKIGNMLYDFFNPDDKAFLKAKPKLPANIKSTKKPEEIIDDVQNKVIQHAKSKDSSPTIISPQTNVVPTGASEKKSVAKSISLSSARNSDSTIQRLSERFMSFGYS